MIDEVKELRNLGNSKGLILPKYMLKHFVNVTKFRVIFDKDKLILIPLKDIEE